MFRFREGEPTLEDIEMINDNCFVGEYGEVKRPPSGTQIATYRNRDRCAVNMCSHI